MEVIDIIVLIILVMCARSARRADVLVISYVTDSVSRCPEEARPLCFVRF